MTIGYTLLAIGYRLFLGLFVRGVLVTLFTIFRKLNFPLHQLFILAGVVVRTLTDRATKLDEVFAEFGFGHDDFV